MNKHERVAAALAGHEIDRPPVGTWRHFVGREANACDLAAAMVEFQRTYDWDWVKVNPRATYFAEAWGNIYDFDAVSDYPVHAISWNSESAGNPSFGEAATMTPAAVMGGVAEDTTLPHGTPADVARAVESALAATGGRHTLISSGCSLDSRTPHDNLLALRDAARAWRA